MMELNNLLAQFPIFTHLDAGEISALAASAVTRRYRNGDWIVHRGDVWPYLFIVESGEINVIKESMEGRSLILETIRPAEIFWGLAFFIDDAPMPAALTTSQESKLVLWSREGLLPLLLRNGRMSWELSCLMIRRMLRVSDIVEDLAFQPVSGRLAGLILDHYQGAEGDYVARDITLDEMAARIGSTREMVCRALYRFAEKGAIDINRTELKIINRGMLENQANR